VPGAEELVGLQAVVQWKAAVEALIVETTHLNHLSRCTARIPTPFSSTNPFVHASEAAAVDHQRALQVVAERPLKNAGLHGTGL
jgi:hypothetical protein